MINFKELEGTIKTIKTTAGSKPTYREKSGIIVLCKDVSKSASKVLYKVEGISLTGKSFIIYIDENSEITDLKVDENTKGCLSQIRKSILRKKEAQEIIIQERNNIESLTIKLLSNMEAMNHADFVEKIRVTLEDLGLDYQISSLHGNTSIDIILEEVILDVFIKKYHIEHVGIRARKQVYKENIEVEELKDNKSFRKFKELEDRRLFLEKYGIKNLFNEDYYKFLINNNLSVKDSSELKGENNNMSYLFLCYVYRENNEFFLNNASIDLILELINILHSCKIES